MSSDCKDASSVTNEMGNYINNEGHIDMLETKCEKHLTACKHCDRSRQVTPAVRILLEKMENNLVTVPQDDGTFRL